MIKQFGLAPIYWQRPISRWVGFLILLWICGGSAILSAQPASEKQLSNLPRKLGTNLRGFGIPFSIHDPENKFIEVQLFLSANRGMSWQFYARQNLDAQEIQFQTNRDGEYWFALKTLDRNRQLQPPGPARPELIVVVDTLLPKVDFRVQSDPAGRLVCRWKADDQNIDPGSVRISYRPLLAINDAENIWIDVPYKAVEPARNGTFSDQYAFWADSSAQEIVVRLKIADLGGNEAVLERQIMAPRMSQNGPRSAENKVVGQPAGIATLRPAIPPSAPSRANSNAAAPNKAESNCPDGKCAITPVENRNGWNARQASTSQNKPPASLPGSNFVAPTKQTSQTSEIAPDATNPAVTGQTQSPVSPHPGSANLYGRTLPADQNQLSNNTGAKQPSNTVNWESKSLSSDGQATNQSQTWPINNSQRPVMIWNEGSTLPAQFETPTEKNEKDSSNPQSPIDDREEIPITKHNAIECELQTNIRPSPMLPTSDTSLSKNIPLPPGEHVQLLEPPVKSQDDRPIATTHNSNASTIQSDHVAAHTVSNSVGSIGESESRDSSGESREGSSVLSTPIKSALPIASPSMNDRASQIQSVNSKRFRLNYENTYLEPESVKSVLLWMTTDGGQTWSSYGEDSDSTSPFPVQVESEGTYGFRVVFESKDGVIGRSPARGDEPDMWIRVDVTLPTAQLISAPFGRGPDAGTLVVHWKADDDDLGERPVKLSWSRLADGPWTTIVQGFPNAGKYSWRAGSDIPERVYLQLEVTDAAGNQAQTETARPVDLAGLVPRGRILSVDPVK